ncbi:MAG: hypothetical protein R3E68_11210 [Burkholderiaceae bacterium]
MAFALFEENGGLKSGTVMSDNGTSLQIELVTGRRAKVKSSHVYLRFTSPEPDKYYRPPSRRPRTSTSTFSGNARPTTSSPSMRWPPTTSARRPTRCSRRHC